MCESGSVKNTTSRAQKQVKLAYIVSTNEQHKMITNGQNLTGNHFKKYDGIITRLMRIYPFWVKNYIFFEGISTKQDTHVRDMTPIGFEHRYLETQHYYVCTVIR